MDKITTILKRFPQYAYNEADPNSALYKLIKAIVDEFNITMSNINRIDNMIGIDKTLPEDLYDRWGALLDIRQNPNETGDQYRDRLKVSIASLSGGTADAIKYAVACGLGINNDPIAMERIRVYDAWKYEGDAEDITKEYGYVVCDIDLNQGAYSSDIEQTVAKSANEAKASGVIIQFIYHNFRIIYYSELDKMTYANLSTSTYNQVGE